MILTGARGRRTLVNGMAGTSMRTTLIISLIAVLMAATEVRSAGRAPVEVAIVVNKANKVGTLSSRELKQIFSGATTRWPDGQPIQTLATGPETPEHRLAIRYFFGMSKPEYQKYALHATFVGETQRVPRDFGLSQTVLKFVGLIPGAIGFVDAGAVNPTVRPVRVDGLSPGDPLYPLTGAT